MQVPQSQTCEATLFCWCLSERWRLQALRGMGLLRSHLHEHHDISKPILERFLCMQGRSLRHILHNNSDRRCCLHAQVAVPK